MIYDALGGVYERYVFDPKDWTLVRVRKHPSKAASSAS